MVLASVAVPALEILLRSPLPEVISQRKVALAALESVQAEAEEIALLSQFPAVK